jgi:hypothetical protein
MTEKDFDRFVYAIGVLSILIILAYHVAYVHGVVR